MTMLKLLLLLTLLPFVEPKGLQVPFEALYGFDIRFNLTIGTPPQKTAMVLYDHMSDPEMYLPDARVYEFGFDLTKSSTYQEITPDDAFGSGINATDDFNINGVLLKQKPFRIMQSNMDKSWEDTQGAGLMGFRRHVFIETLCFKPHCTTFVESVTRDYDENVFVVVFDEIKRNYSDLTSYTGQLNFGDKAPALCNSNNWGFMKEIKNKVYPDEQWTFNVDRISVGKFTYAKSIQAIISTNSIFYVPSVIYDAIMKTLGSKDSFNVDCKSTARIVFEMGGKQLSIGPETYIDFEDEHGQCSTSFFPSSEDAITIPMVSFTNHCILYDYDNIQVGFTDRV